MVSRTDDKIDFSKLEDEVHAAVDADDRYWRENSAKFRAVEQKVASYDEFRDIVLASHLKPLEKHDRLDKIEFVQPFNSVASKHKDENETQSASPFQTQKLDKLPSNGMEFGRDWRRNCKTNKDKFDFLIRIGGDELGKIFKAEISFGLLGEFLLALESEYDDVFRENIMDILHGFSTANRFSLSVQFLSSKEKEALKKLHDQCSKILESDLDEESLLTVKDKLASISEKYELQ